MSIERLAFRAWLTQSYAASISPLEESNMWAAWLACSSGRATRCATQTLLEAHAANFHCAPYDDLKAMSNAFACELIVAGEAHDALQARCDELRQVIRVDPPLVEDQE